MEKENLNIKDCIINNGTLRILDMEKFIENNKIFIDASIIFNLMKQYNIQYTRYNSFDFDSITHNKIDFFIYYKIMKNDNYYGIKKISEQDFQKEIRLKKLKNILYE